MRKYLWIILLVAGAGITACKKTTDRQNVFYYNQIGGLESLDPAFAKNLSVMWAVHALYNTLVDVDSQMNLVPLLAKSWSISDDGLKYTFTLQPHVYFHDNAAFENGKGRKMNAADVVYSFQRIIDPKVSSSGAWIFNGRVSETNPFVALNDSVFEMNLKEPFLPLLELLSMPYCSVVPREVVEKWGKDYRSHPCGTGPFKLNYWDEGSVLVLGKNENYWEYDNAGEKLPYLDAVQISFHETRSMEFLLLQQDGLDFVNGIDGSMKDLVLTKRGELKRKFQENIQLLKGDYLNIEYLGFMVDSSEKQLHQNIAAQQKFRQAVNAAIDKAKIVTYFRNGVGKPAYNGFVPPLLLLDDTVAFLNTYRPAYAKALLEELKKILKNNTLPSITLSTPDAYVDIANFVATQLEEVGIKVQIQAMLPGTLRQQMTRSELAFFKASWIADYPNAESFLACFYSEFPAPPNYSRFKNKAFDKMYLQSLNTVNYDERYALYRKMDSLLMLQVPVIPLFYDERLHFLRKSISGFKSTPLNIIELKLVRKSS